jgi:D-tyrosyl-tRNA(Tyr) deacylase
VRAVVQRVASAKVTVDGDVRGAIGAGLLVYLGIGKGDDETALGYIADKVIGMRIFADDAGKMNRSVLESGGEVLVVSQFTLYGDMRRGRRPGFDQAMEPEAAKAMYDRFVAMLAARGARVQTGEFRAHMIVDSQVDGPITILVDSSRTF